MNENSSITTQRAAEMLGVSVSSIYRIKESLQQSNKVRKRLTKSLLYAKKWIDEIH